MKSGDNQLRQVPLVRLYPDCMERHTSPIFYGLIELARTGKIELEATTRFSTAPRQYTKHTVWMEVTLDGVIYKVCFDMSDSAQIVSTDGIAKSDVYFKRSYSHEYVNRLSEANRLKMLPFGLYYPIAPPLTLNMLKCCAIYFSLNGSELTGLANRIRDAWSEFIKLILVKAHLKYGYEIPVRLEDLIAEDTQVQNGVVIFQTRVWESEFVPGMDSELLRHLNDNRANIVRLLKERYGDRFRGGVFNTPLARKEYPDCITSLPSDRYLYLREMKTAQIAVTSTGLHGSIGAKLPEYLAAGKAVVSEPNDCILPLPLVEGKNILYYQTPERCLEKCELLSEDPSLAARMQMSNREYFVQNLRPDNLLKHCFELMLKRNLQLMQRGV